MDIFKSLISSNRVKSNQNGTDTQITWCMHLFTKPPDQSKRFVVSYISACTWMRGIRGQFSWRYRGYFRQYRLQMVIFMKQPLHGQILVELEENWNDNKILLGGDIGFKLSQILSDIVKKTFRLQKFIISIVFYSLLSSFYCSLFFSDNITIGCQNY